MRSTAARVTTPESVRRPRGRRLAVGVFAALALSAGAVALTPSAALADGNSGSFLGHLNSLRAAHGLPGLTVASDLTAVASAHSAQMAASATIYHNASLTSVVANWQTLGENVGMGPSVSAIDNAFDASPDHYANEINSSYTQVGIGSVTDSRGEIFVTLDFRRPMNATTPAPKPVAKAPVVKAPVKAPVVKAPVVKAPTTTAPKSTAPVNAKAVAKALTPAQQAALAGVRAAAARRAAGIVRENAQLRAMSDPLARAIVFQQNVTALQS
jgi:uncharacterized protein YkwD